MLEVYIFIQDFYLSAIKHIYKPFANKVGFVKLGSLANFFYDMFFITLFAHRKFPAKYSKAPNDNPSFGAYSLKCVFYADRQPRCPAEHHKVLVINLPNRSTALTCRRTKPLWFTTIIRKCVTVGNCFDQMIGKFFMKKSNKSSLPYASYPLPSYLSFSGVPSSTSAYGPPKACRPAATRPVKRTAPRYRRWVLSSLPSG